MTDAALDTLIAKLKQLDAEKTLRHGLGHGVMLRESVDALVALRQERDAARANYSGARRLLEHADITIADLRREVARLKG